MARKLHNSIIATLSSSTALIALLLLAHPAADVSQADTLTQETTVGTPIQAQQDVLPRSTHRQWHQSVKVPFFSFSPRS